MGLCMANHKNARDGVALARQAYLYGIGNNGVPLRDRKRLVEMSMVTDATLGVHIKKWEADAEKLAKNCQDSSYGMMVKEETVFQHESDVSFLRREADRIKDEVDNVDDIQRGLWDLVQSISEISTSEQIDSLITLIDRYLKKSTNRQSLLTVFLSLQKRWQDSSGMTGSIEATVAGMKEVEKQKRLLELREKHGPEKPDKGGPAHVRDGAIFKR